MAKTIIVSNRLPVKLNIEEDKVSSQTSEGGLATGLGSIYKQGNNVWLGWPGLATDDERFKKEIAQSLKKESMAPVFLTTQEIEDFYEGFCNETIWPNFHYFNQYALYNEHMWLAYQQVNQKFADQIERIAQPDDTIWVHDYQLLLLPQLVRAKFPDISIGFFLHIPFPSYESFRLLPWRRELLTGMVGADFLGFHTYDDMRHFLSSASRLAGLGNANGKITVGNRKIMADALPMGIDYEKYANVSGSAETLEREDRYRKSLGNQKLILSIDRLDYSKGIPQRLKAFELFLEQYPEFREKVSIIMVVVPSRDSVGKYKELKEEVDLLVGRINGNYSRLNWTPIHYFYRSFPLHALSAFYRMAEVALVTPMRDGMNLVCKEFIASKLDKKGVLILSEMAGASKELSDAIQINPNDIHALVDAIYQALNMSESEQKNRMEVMQKSLKHYNIHHWVNLFMDRLKHIKAEQHSLKTKILDESTKSLIQESYAKANHRLLLLDYDGTLTDFSGNPQLAVPNEELHQLIDRLVADPKNKLVIISGRDKSTLEEWFGNKPIEFVAEHGVWKKEQNKKWETITHLTNHWKIEMKNVLEGYVDRTPGSFIEEKDYSLVWHYRKVETGLGEIRTRELTSHLKYLAGNQNLHVLEGNMVVEIKNSEVNKGRAAEFWLNKFPSEFILAIGDDVTDEDTFLAMPNHAYTIKVGTAASAAKFSLQSVQEVRSLLIDLGQS